METNKQDIMECFEKWNHALQTKDPGKVASMYGPGAILVPTLSNRIRHSRQEITDYFDHFLTKEPTGRLTESNIRVYGDTAVNSGLYIFNLLDADGNRREVQARFTFVYRRFGSGWMIVEHHSSLMPE